MSAFAEIKMGRYTRQKASFLKVDSLHWEVFITDYQDRGSHKKVGDIRDRTQGNGGPWRVTLDGQPDETIESFRVAQFYVTGVLECNNDMAND